MGIMIQLLHKLLCRRLRNEPPEVIKFAIISVGRSGSNLLCDLLNKHPQILCHHEVFHSDKIWFARGYEEQLAHLGSIRQRNLNPFAFCQHLWQENDGNQAVGFKVLSGQGNELYDSLLSSAWLKKIVLRRRNHMHKYVSHLRAVRSAQWSSDDKVGDVPYDVPVEVDADKFQTHIGRDHAFFSRVVADLKALGQTPLELAYEDLLLPETQRTIIEFIGVDPSTTELKSEYTKQASGKETLRDMITNFDEVLEKLRGTPFEAELLAGGNEPA